MKFVIEANLVGNPDLLSVSDAIHDYLCRSGDDDMPGIESFDSVNPSPYRQFEEKEKT